MSKRGATIIATTARRVRLLSLGGIYRQVAIDPVEQIITIHRRYAWFFRKHCAIGFAEIEAVTYGYEDQAIQGSFVHESYDCFTVGLRLRDDSEVVLHRFSGEGTLVNETIFPDWLMQPFGFELVGTQERDSRSYVELVSRLVDVPTIPHRGF
ncbi:MAG: hypothetical protein AAGJ83_04035 [Planctomycetota bacterium]